MNKTMGDYLRKIAPQEMNEFYRMPWDYQIHCPMSTEDPATIEVHLEYGTTKCEKVVDITINLFSGQITIRTTDKKGVVNA
jgi:hypothetical protein